MIKKTLKFYKQNTASVEIVFNNELVKVFFVIHPLCKNISELSKKKLMIESKRNTIQDKINVKIYYETKKSFLLKT